MTFSIIIPAYNEEQWLGKTLDAVLAQTYADFEVLVIDNNSADRTADVVRTYAKKDHRVKLFHCSIQGILPARNVGLQQAQGTFIAQLDADNIPNAQWLEHALRHFNETQAAAVIGNYDYYDANAAFRYFTLLSQYVALSLGNYYLKKRRYGAIMLGGNAFIRKDILERLGGYDSSYTFYSDDLVTACRVSEIGDIVFYRDLQVKSSARRYKQVGYLKLQKKYSEGVIGVFLGRGLPEPAHEIHHPR